MTISSDKYNPLFMFQNVCRQLNVPAMGSPYNEFLQGCSNVSNCKIICKDNNHVLTHKIVLAVCGDFLKDLIQDVPVADNITIYLPDYNALEIEAFIEKKLMKEPINNISLDNVFSFKKECTPEQLLQVKLEEESKKICPQRRKQESTSYDDEDSLDIQENCNLTEQNGNMKLGIDEESIELDDKKNKKNKSKSMSLSKKSEYKPRNVDFEKLTQKLLPNPQTREDFKHNEIIEKQILHEKAIEAYLRFVQIIA